MKSNLGSNDKIVRVLLGVALSYIAYNSPETAQWIRVVMYVVSAILFLTTALGSCPLYSLFKINTCKIDN